MLGAPLQKAVQALISENDTSAYSLCQLLRITALTSAQASSGLSSVHEALKPFYGFPPLLEALVARVKDIIEAEDTSRGAIEPELDSLLKEVKYWEEELAEQLSAVFTADDSVVILAERNGVVEQALEKAEVNVNVFVVQVAPDEQGAEDMVKRLSTKPHLTAQLARDTQITHALTKAKKVILSAAALDIEEGALVAAGGMITACAANRLRIPIVLTVARHTVVPTHCGVIGSMFGVGSKLGAIWTYEESRDDTDGEPVQVVGGGWEVVSVQRMEAIVTGGGGIAPELARMLAPGVGEE